MDSNFIDLDILITRVKDPKSKIYFLEAVRAYKAGALRATLSSTWVAVVYDLISKYRELAVMGDAAASSFIKTWDTATASRDRKKLIDLEATILMDATTNVQLLNPIAGIHLNRLREDRHLCAHPAFSTEADLFEPSPELARLHLVNAIDLVLAQEPLQGKAILEQFDVDVQSTGFPSVSAKVLDYVEQRYLSRVRSQNIRNFGLVLAKSLLKGIPPQWERQHHKIVASLVATRERASEFWPEISSAIARLVDGIEPEHRTRVVAFLAEFPDFWPPLAPATKTALLETVANIDAATLTDFRVLKAIGLPAFRQSLLKVINCFGTNQLRKAIATEPLAELWPSAIDTYSDSLGFRSSEANFNDFVSPFSGRLTSAQHAALLNAIEENGQNWDAAATPSLLFAVLKNSTAANLPCREARDKFYQFLRRMGQLGHYKEVVELLQSDGWTPPPAEETG